MKPIPALKLKAQFQNTKLKECVNIPVCRNASKVFDGHK
jgi:hypothetical protein